MRVAVVGAGIVGLAVARQLRLERPDWDIVVLEREPEVAAHQTGHNSGVVHAGIYYVPGSLKARLCRRGASLLEAFCGEHGVAYRAVGKVIVARDEREVASLHSLRVRALANGVSDAALLDASGLRAVEPHAVGVAALHSPSTAVVDFAVVARAIAGDLQRRGGEVRLSSGVVGVRHSARRVILETSSGPVVADHVVQCAGLDASRLAQLSGDDDDPRIVPFRGEFYRLAPPSADLVRGLIYPVPDPRYPFLGIHLTRRIDDTVEVGPNAVLAFALHGYRRRDVSLKDLVEIFSWAGFRRTAGEHWRTGLREMIRSLSRRYFLMQARRYVPELSFGDLLERRGGVRAQAVRQDGTLLDDFCITARDRLTIVRNAPSPAATSALAIAEHVSNVVLEATDARIPPRPSGGSRRRSGP